MNKKIPIFLSSWSVRDQVKSGNFKLAQLAAFAKEKNFQGVEFVDRHFDNLSPEFIKPVIQSIKQTAIDTTLGLTTDFTIEKPERWQRQVN